MPDEEYRGFWSESIRGGLIALGLCGAATAVVLLVILLVSGP